MPFATRSFDVCLMMAALAHVDDERALLAEMRRALRRQCDEVLEHRRRHRRAELVARVREIGLRVEWRSYTTFFVFPPAFAGRMLRRWTGNAPSIRTDFVNLPGPLNRVLVDADRCESALARSPSLPLGVSAACVAHSA